METPSKDVLIEKKLSLQLQKYNGQKVPTTFGEGAKKCLPVVSFVTWIDFTHVSDGTLKL